MLQIATGLYFGDAPLHETVQRATYYTNAQTYAREPVNLPDGRLLVDTVHDGPVTAVSLEVLERQPKERPDGTPRMLIATGGRELLDDAAAVLGFATNTTWSSSLARVNQLVATSLPVRPGHGPANILRRTFDPGVHVTVDELSAAAAFWSGLVLLRRSHFEATILAIRKIRDATYLVGDDPSLAYSLFVAALESLAQLSTEGPDPADGWELYDGQKRKLLDDALASADADTVDRVRRAVLAGDWLSLGSRFRSFILDHVGPNYYRFEAVDALRPLRATELPRALRDAYALRSRNVHALEVLQPELWAVSDRSETLRTGTRTLLTLEGLNRLSRHVVRAFVDRAPRDFDASFDYENRLPGLVRLPLSPQHWIGNAAGFNRSTARLYLDAFVGQLVVASAAKEPPTLTNLDQVLAAVERLAPAEGMVAERLPMIAIYVLWHSLLDPAHHRPGAQTFLGRFSADLDEPTVVGFVVRVLTRHPIEWETEALDALVRQRQEDLTTGKGQPLPPRVDAALLLCLAGRLSADGHSDEALTLVAQAVEMLPGERSVLQMETAAHVGGPSAVDLLDFVAGVERDPPTE